MVPHASFARLIRQGCFEVVWVVVFVVDFTVVVLAERLIKSLRVNGFVDPDALAEETYASSRSFCSFEMKVSSAGVVMSVLFFVRVPV
jgi:hypothetical protein